MSVDAAGRAGTRWLWLAGGAVSAVLAVTGLAACGDTPEPDPAAVVRIAIGDPHGLVPSNVSDPAGAQVLAALFAPLVDVDDQGRPYEVAASSIEPSQDGRVWTVRLRDGFTFHNGEPVTAGSYLNAWNFGAYQPNRQRNQHLFARIEGYAELNPGGGQEPTARTLSGLAKVDEHTFTVRLAAPFMEFRSVLSAPAFYPLPNAAFASPGVLREEFEQAPVGNGRFRMVGGWQRGARIEVELYLAYPGEAPRIGGVEFLLYGEPADAYPDLLDGEVDVLTQIPPERLATVRADLGERYLRYPAPMFQYLAVPTYLAEFANPDVRRAISMAIDRDRIAETIFRGAQAPARAFVAPVVPGARADTCGAACALDPATARDLYARAGGPERITITYNADGDHQDWVEATCEQLRAHLRVECEARAEPTLDDVLARVDAQEPVGLLRLGWAMDYPSMESYLGPVYSTTGSANFSGYRNPEFDQLLAAAAAGSPEQALAAYQRAEDILARDLPVIPLRFGQHTIGYSPGVREVHVSRLGQIDLTRLEVLR